jgi:hypothetical protein
MTRRTRLHIEALEDRCLPSFSPAVSYPGGSSPQSLATADFNNDGRLDLVTSNPGDNTICVLLGDGQGGFGSAADFDAWPTELVADRASLAVADFNQDGSLDVATVQFGYEAEYWLVSATSLLLGNGDGTFQPATFIGGGALAVAAGDLNNDGHMDLVFGCDDYNSFGYLQVYLGNGAGGFTYPASHWLSGAPDALTVGDVNGDRKLDVMVLHGNGYFIPGNGDGTFMNVLYNGEFYTTPGGLRVALGDLTGDGKLDVVFPGATIATHSWGVGGFSGPTNHSANGNLHTGVAMGDFNGDGHLDGVTSDADTGTISALLGNGNGTLSYVEAFATGSSPWAVAVGDFNGDGYLDVAAANGGSNTVSVLLNDGDWDDLPPPPPPTPTLAIDNAAVTEGNTGAVSATFTVSLSAPINVPVTVSYSTADSSATAGSDYQAASGTLTFAPGETTKTITVLVNGDRLGESHESYSVRLTNATAATIAQDWGNGTIFDDEPWISISDVTVTEGNTGSVNATFTVTLSFAYDADVTAHCGTADGSATADSDYTAGSGVVTIPAGQTSATVPIAVLGDRLGEPTESFAVNLSGVSNAYIADGQGVGAILDDEPRISITNVTKKEGNGKKTTLFTFTVTLSAAYDQAVTMSYSTVNGTATTGDGDYLAKTGTLTFAPGQTTKTITIEVKGDRKWEPNETFYLDLFGLSSNALFTKNRGIGTILNDD